MGEGQGQYVWDGEAKRGWDRLRRENYCIWGGKGSHSNRPLEKGSIGTKHDISGKLTLRLFFDPLEGS